MQRLQRHQKAEMQKLPKIKNPRSWSIDQKRRAWIALELSKRRRRRQQSVPSEITLLSGLLAYWKLDEASGVRVDSSGHGLDLTDVNGVGQEPGIQGSAAKFTHEGTDRWLDHPDDPLLRFETDFTISAWVYRSGAMFDTNTILNTTSGFYFYTHDSVEQRPVLAAYDEIGTPIVYFAGSDIVETNSWYHLVCYREGDTFGIVTNGGEPVTAIGVGSPRIGETFRIGAHEGGYPFYGLIDEVAKWNRALSIEEIALLYNESNGLPLESF